MDYMGFKAVKASAAAGGARDPGAVAAAIGRKKYGSAKFQGYASKGKSMKGVSPLKKKKKKVKTGAVASMLGAKFGKKAY